MAEPAKKEPEKEKDKDEKEEFRAYLKRTGVLDALSKVLTALYDAPVRPEDTQKFLKEQLGPLIGVDIPKLEKENAELKSRLKAVEGGGGSAPSSQAPTGAPPPVPSGGAPGGPVKKK